MVINLADLTPIIALTHRRREHHDGGGRQSLKNEQLNVPHSILVRGTYTKYEVQAALYMKTVTSLAGARRHTYIGRHGAD